MPSVFHVSTGSTVLFVDDDPLLLGAFARSLRGEPYRVLCAPSGARALAILEDDSVDVIVSDESMPELSGTQLLELVRVRFPRVTRILLSGSASRDAAVRLNLYRSLAKPITPRDLTRTIDGALAMRRLVATLRPKRMRMNREDEPDEADLSERLQQPQ